MKKELEKLVNELNFKELCELRNKVDEELYQKRPESFNDLIKIEELGLDPYVTEELLKAGYNTLGDIFYNYRKRRLTDLSERVMEDVKFVIRTYDMDRFNDYKKPEKLDKMRK